MEGRCVYVETSPSPFSSAGSAPREVEFLQGLQMTSIRNPCVAPVEYRGNTYGFVDHHFSSFSEVVIIEHALSLLPEGCAGTAYTVLNFCFKYGRRLTTWGCSIYFDIRRSFNVAWSGYMILVFLMLVERHRL